MSFQITFSRRFQKNFRSLSEKEQKQVRNKLKILTEDPSHPSLRVKRIQGTKNLFECSINMDIRIIWYYEKDTIIILADIGHHDILKKY